jgi:hypothetical protein
LKVGARVETKSFGSATLGENVLRRIGRKRKYKRRKESERLTNI